VAGYPEPGELAVGDDGVVFAERAGQAACLLADCAQGVGLAFAAEELGEHRGDCHALGIKDCWVS
jgi:hypothetical protein